MNEFKVELALEIMQLKIIHFIKHYEGHDKEEFEKGLKFLIEEREKVYNLDTETINKVYDVYLNELKREK